MDPLATKYFPEQNTVDESARQSLSFGVRQNPDQFAKDLSLGMVGSQNAQARDDAAFSARLKSLGIETLPPATKQLYSDPSMAGLAWDDLHGVAAMEALSNQFHYDGLTPGQTRAVMEDRARRQVINASTSEYENLKSKSLESSFGMAADVLDKFLGTMGAGFEYLNDRFKQKVVKQADGTYAYEDDAAAQQHAKDIAGDMHNSASYRYMEGMAGNFHKFLMAGAKADVPQQLIDPDTGKAFANPDYSAWGRGFVNQLEAMPGVMASASASGGTGLFEFLMGTSAAMAAKERADAAGDNGYESAAKGVAVGGLNLGMFMLGGAPGSMAKTMQTEAQLEAPAASNLDAIAKPLLESAKRGIGLAAGLTAAEELVQNADRLDKLDWRDTAKQFLGSAANFTAFELAHAIQPVTANVQYMRAVREEMAGMKLQKRNLEAFRDMADKTSNGQEVVITKADLDSYCQSSGIRVPEILGESGLRVKDQYANATESTPLRIKLSDYLAYTADKSPETEARLDDLLRFKDTEMSPAEAKTLLNAKFLADQRWAVRLGLQSEEPEIPTDDYKQIHDSTKSALMQLFNEPTADAYATWHASTIMNLADRLGVDPMVMADRFESFKRVTEQQGDLSQGAQRRDSGARMGTDQELQKTLADLSASSTGEGATRGTVEGSTPIYEDRHSGDVTGYPVTAALYEGDHVMVAADAPGVPYLTGTVKDNLFHVGELSGEDTKGAGYDLYQSLARILQQKFPDVTHVVGLAGGTAEDPEGIVRLRNAFNDTQWAGSDVTNRWAGTPVKSMAEGPVWRDNDPREVQRRAADRRVHEEEGGFTSTTAARSSWAFTRRNQRDVGGDGVRTVSGVPVIESWQLGKDHVELLGRMGFACPEVHELDYKDPMAAPLFREAIAALKENNKYAASVHVYSDEEYKGMRLFLTDGRDAGFALKPDGDIVSVFSHQNPEAKGAAHEMLEIAKQAGGSKLDCFETILPTLYGDHGFYVAARMNWDDMFAPEGWDFETFKKFNNGRPDVVYMALDNTQPIYAHDQGSLVKEYEDAINMQFKAQILGGAEVLREPDSVLAQSLSTRQPEGKNATEDYQNELLITDLASAKMDPASFEKNVERMSKILNFPPAKPGTSVERRAEAMISHMQRNLTWLFKQTPPEIRDMAKLWYVGGEDIATRWAERYGKSKPQLAGIMACLSPQKDWFMNVSLAQRLLDILDSKQDQPWTPEMSAFAKESLKPAQRKLAEGKTLAQCATNAEKAVWVRCYDEAHNPRDFRSILPDGTFGDFVTNNPAKGQEIGERTKIAWSSFPAIEKAVSCYYDGSMNNISKSLGKEHKVRNFYNNIFSPSSDKFVTIDTHAVAAALMRGLGGSAPEVLDNLGGGSSSMSSGVRGTYAIYAEAYFRAAAEMGVLPRELQSITWEAIRSMMPAPFKRAQTRSMDELESLLGKVSSGAVDKKTGKPFTFKDVTAMVTDKIQDPDVLKMWRKVARGKGEDAELTKSALEASRPYLEGQVDKVWRQFQAGKISQEEAQDKIMKVAQKWRKDDLAVGKPVWYGTEGNPAEESTYGQPVVFQSKPEGTRGNIVFGDDNKISINLFKDADLSTLVHELSHAYFRIFQEAVANGTAPEAENKRYAKMLDWLGAKPGEKLTKPQVEKLARAEEQWLHEGKTPSADLAPVFTRLSQWMRSVYGQVAAYHQQRDETGENMQVKLNPDIVDFFDRLHASDKAIEEMKDFAPRYTSAESMGVPQPVYDTYVKMAGRALDSARQDLTEKLLKQGERRVKSWWKAEEDKVRDEVTTQVDASPVMKAMKALKDGEMELPGGGRMEVTFSRAAMIERYGEEATKEFSAKIQRHISNVGADPDSVAELLGFKSGDEMLQAIMSSPRRSEVIKNATAQEMARRHGDMMLDGTIADEAVRALHGDDRAKLIQQEMAILEAQRRKANVVDRQRIQEQAENLRDVSLLHKEQDKNAEAERKTAARVQAKVNAEEIKEAMASLPKLADVKAKATEDISSMTLRELRPNQFLGASRRASRQSMERGMKGDYEGAVAAQQEYLVNHFRYLEASRLRDEVTSQVMDLRNMQSKDMQANLGKAGGDFLGQINSLLERVGLRTISAQQVEKNQTLAQWADEMLARGSQPFVAPKLLDEARKTNYADMTIKDFQDLHDTVMSIAHVAKQELSLMLGDRRAKFADVVNEAINTSAPRKFPDPEHSGGDNTYGGFGHFIRSYDAMSIKMATMVDKLDGGNIDGVWRQTMLDPIRNATNEWHTLTEEYVKTMHDKMQMTSDMAKKLSDKVTLPSGKIVNRNQILAMVLNCGNADNRTMLENYEKGNFTKADVEAAVRAVTPEEAQFIQGVWDVVESLRPKIGALEKRLNGLEPTWVKATPIIMGGKEYRGGYYPLVADRTTRTGRAQSQKPEQLFEDGCSGVGTVHGFTVDRTGRQYKLDLNWRNIVTAHLNAVVKDLAFREAVISVNKFISNDDVRKTVRECLGPEYEAQLTPWLRSIVNDQNGSRLQGTNGVDTFVNKARGHAVNMMIGFRVSSSIVQVADMVRVLPLVNTFRLAQGFYEYSTSPNDATDFIMRSSKLMAHRAENLDRDVREKMANLLGDNSTAAAIKKAGYAGFSIIDKQVSRVAWMGAYREAMASTGDHDTAVRMADRVIEQGLQSGEAMDLVALQRNHPITKMFTMFCGDSIAAYNLCRVLGQNVTGPASAMRFALGFVMSTAVANLLSDWITARKPEDAGPEWYAYQAALSPFRMLPIVKDAMSAWEARAIGGGGVDYRWSPLLSALEKTADGIYAQKKFFLDDTEDAAQWMKDTATASGYLFGVTGGAQAISSADYLRGVATGEISPNDPLEFAAGATIGGRK